MFGLHYYLVLTILKQLLVFNHDYDDKSDVEDV